MQTKLSERIRPNSEAAPWVIDEVKKLEKENEMMLDTLNKLIGVANSAVPIKFIEQLDGVIREANEVLKQIEGQQQ